MISRIEPTAAKRTTPLYQVKVVLWGTKPAIWRQLQLPGNANLVWLHAVLQVAVGWTNSHLHQFKVGGACYSDTRHLFAESEGDPEVLEEREFSLEQIAPREADVIEYEYDFGDSWQHALLVEKILPPQAGSTTTAVCLDGARACPPEDCGGIWGYSNLLKILKNPKHREYRTMKEWLGRPFHAAAFDVAKANFWLGKIRWPRPTDAQLRKVLMARDGYRE